MQALWRCFLHGYTDLVASCLCLPTYLCICILVVLFPCMIHGWLAPSPPCTASGAAVLSPPASPRASHTPLVRIPCTLSTAAVTAHAVWTSHCPGRGPVSHSSGGKWGRHPWLTGVFIHSHPGSVNVFAASRIGCVSGLMAFPWQVGFDVKVCGCPWPLRPLCALQTCFGSLLFCWHRIDPYRLLRLAMFSSLTYTYFFFPWMIVKGIFRHPYLSYWIVNLSWWIRLIKMALEEKSLCMPPKLK